MPKWSTRFLSFAAAGMVCAISFGSETAWAGTTSNPTIYPGEVIDVTVAWNYNLNPDPKTLASQGYVSFEEHDGTLGDVQLGTAVLGTVVSTNGNQTTYEVTVPNLNAYNPSNLFIVVNSMAPYYTLGYSSKTYNYSSVPVAQLPEAPYGIVFPLLALTGATGAVMYAQKRRGPKTNAV